MNSRVIPDGAVKADVFIEQDVAHGIFDAALASVSVLTALATYLQFNINVDPTLKSRFSQPLPDIKAAAVKILEASQRLLPVEQQRDCVEYVDAIIATKLEETSAQEQQIRELLAQLSDAERLEALG